MPRYSHKYNTPDYSVPRPDRPKSEGRDDEARRTIADLATSWNPYLTIGEPIHLAALWFTRDPSKPSCRAV